MAKSATLTSKFQISIPKEVRERQNWKAGDELTFIPDGRSVKLVRVPKLEELLGALPNANTENYRDEDDRF